jgi:hypothetical protein
LLGVTHNRLATQSKLIAQQLQLVDVDYHGAQKQL